MKRATSERDRTALARIFAAAGLELRRDLAGVAQVVTRENRRGLRLQRAAQVQHQAGKPILV